MKISNLQAINFINMAGGTLKEKYLPVRVSFAVRQNYAHIIDTIIGPYEATRKDLLEKVNAGKIDQTICEKELKKLLKDETEFVGKTITIDDLEKVDQDPCYNKLSVAEIDAMAFMIKDCKDFSGC